MNPVGRRESLDASHGAQELQATLLELRAWARGLRAEMDTRSAPHSPAEARRMLEEHRERRVSGPRPWAFPGAAPPLCPLPVCDPNCCSGPFPPPASALLFFHPTPQPPPTSPPARWAGALRP